MSGMTTQSVSMTDNVLLESAVLSQDLLNNILLQIVEFDQFVTSVEFHRNQHLAQLTKDISQFVELTTLLAKMLNVKKNIQVPQIKNSHIHLLFVLKGIIQSQQKQDLVVLEDLIKYELKDNLTQWKIDLIPTIKRHLQT